MSLEYITKVLRVDVKPTQKLILIVLANYSDEFGQAYPSHRKLTELTGLSLSAIKDNLKKLQELGYINWEKRNNTSNLYQILGGSGDGYTPPASGYNTKANTKTKYILELDNIFELYKSKTSKVHYSHDSNFFIAEPRWKQLRELGRKGIISPKTGEKLDLTSDSFWSKYFEIANSQGHINYLNSFMSGKPNLRTLLSTTQFNTIIERKYG